MSTAPGPWADDMAFLLITARRAGKAILEVYESEIDVDYKDDKSPLTEADRRSHEVIAARLARHPAGHPVLSEEGRDMPYAERSGWRSFWLVDPLDGTKEFIKRNGEFTVNIALIEDGRPVAGIVYLPVKDIYYFAAPEGFGAWRLEGSGEVDSWGEDSGEKELTAALQRAGRLPLSAPPAESYVVIGSRSHSTPELEAFVEEARKSHGKVEFISAGSSLKFCLVAEGLAHVYPRYGPTMEWDTGAGQAVVEGAGGSVVNYETGRPLTYNKENLLNPWFTVKTASEEA